MAAKLAFISDIHGNRPALEVVLKDIDRRGADRIYNLGDSLFGPLDPAGTFALLTGREITHLRGNGDRELLGPDDGSDTTLNRQRRGLSPAERAWLEAQPGRIDEGDLTAFHASPGSDDAYLLECLTEAGVALRPADEVQAGLTGVWAEAVVCGHSHRPGILRLPDGRLVVNAGSVGLPAYYDDRPSPHKMESGGPEAKYALLEKSGGGWRAEIVEVVYDCRAAADMALTQGRPDWAEWLMSGRVPQR